MDYNPNININKKSDIPIFEQIAQQIKSKINTGEIKPGSKLPPERILAQKLEVARGTVKKAYNKLAAENTIKLIQGSGCYVLNNWDSFSATEKKKATALISDAVESIREMGLSDKEIQNLVDMCFSSGKIKKDINIALIANSRETLIDFRSQLNYLPNTNISIFITESITLNRDSQSLFKDFHIIIVSSIDYEEIAAALPDLKNKMVRAAISTASDTFIQIMALDKKSKIGIICRTDEFLQTVKNTLISLGFSEKNLLSYFEKDYTTKTYFPEKIDALITFKDSSIFTDSAFDFRNKEFIDRGGKLIKFEYMLDRGTMIYIEDKINEIN